MCKLYEGRKPQNAEGRTKKLLSMKGVPPLTRCNTDELILSPKKTRKRERKAFADGVTEKRDHAGRDSPMVLEAVQRSETGNLVVKRVPVPQWSLDMAADHHEISQAKHINIKAECRMDHSTSRLALRLRAFLKETSTTSWVGS